MTALVQTIAGILLAYLVGSIPFGLFLGKLKGVDIRTRGSGNIGATNLTRNVGKPWGVACFALDFLKGLLPVLIFPLSFPEALGTLNTMKVLCALAAVLGHIYPVYLRFKGGKGVSTTLGALVAVAWIPVLIAMAVWGIVFKLSRYVSIASMAAAISLPVAALIGQYSWDVVTAFLVLAILIIYRHRSNIAKLKDGTENRFSPRQAKS